MTPDADFGLCVENALNIKRGYWRIKARPSFNGTRFDESSANSGHSQSYSSFSQTQTYFNEVHPPSGPGGGAGISPIGSGNTPGSHGNEGSAPGSGVGGASLKDISMDSSPASGLNTESAASASAGGGQGTADSWQDQFYALSDQLAADSSQAQQSSTQKVEFMNCVPIPCLSDLTKPHAPVPILMSDFEAASMRMAFVPPGTNDAVNTTEPLGVRDEHGGRERRGRWA